MKYESACGPLIQMHYGMFDDDRMRFFSWGGKSFIERVRDNNNALSYFKNFMEQLNKESLMHGKRK